MPVQIMVEIDFNSTARLNLRVYMQHTLCCLCRSQGGSDRGSPVALLDTGYTTPCRISAGHEGKIMQLQYQIVGEVYSSTHGDTSAGYEGKSMQLALLQY